MSFFLKLLKVIVPGVLVTLGLNAADTQVETSAVNPNREESTCPLHASDTQDYTSTFTIWDENDFWGFWSDKYYTNHTRFGLTHIIPGKPCTAYFGSIGQEFYTPKDKTAPAAPIDDHPYAGFLYASGGFAIYDSNLLISMELQLGVLGPSAIGYEVQRAWHKGIGDPVPNGWDSQIEDQLGANLLMEIRQRITLVSPNSSRHNTALSEHDFACDAIFRGFAVAGTVRTMASIGAQLRFGYNLPEDFGFSTLRQSTSFVMPTQGQTSIYGFIDLQGDGLVYDATLGGELLRESDTEINPYPFAIEGSIGIGINYGRWSLQIFQSFRSKDFSEADKDFFAFGGFRLSTSF